MYGKPRGVPISPIDNSRFITASTVQGDPALPWQLYVHDIKTFSSKRVPHILGDRACAPIPVHGSNAVAYLSEAGVRVGSIGTGKLYPTVRGIRPLSASTITGTDRIMLACATKSRLGAADVFQILPGSTIPAKPAWHTNESVQTLECSPDGEHIVYDNGNLDLVYETLKTHKKVKLFAGGGSTETGWATPWAWDRSGKMLAITLDNPAGTSAVLFFDSRTMRTCTVPLRDREINLIILGWRRDGKAVLAAKYDQPHEHREVLMIRPGMDWRVVPEIE